jgi:hypothetical protein
LTKRHGGDSHFLAAHDGNVDFAFMLKREDAANDSTTLATIFPPNCNLTVLISFGKTYVYCTNINVLSIKTNNTLFTDLVFRTCRTGRIRNETCGSQENTKSRFIDSSILFVS